MLKVSNALILDFFTALSLVNVPLQKIEATPKFCDSYRYRVLHEIKFLTYLTVVRDPSSFVSKCVR